MSDRPPSPPPASALAPERSARPLHVLAAEDSPVNRRLLRAVLEQRGHTLVLAENGREALEALERDSFDVVLMDVQMAEMNGLQATAAIRARERGTGARLPIIALTGSDASEGAEQCLAAGMDAHLSKPFHYGDLIALVESLAAPFPGPAEPAGSRPALQAPGDAESAQALARVFLADAAALTAEIRGAVARRDDAALQGAAHRLRGSAGCFRAERVFELAKRLEELGTASGRAAAERDCEELSRELARLARDLGADPEKGS